MKFGEPPPIKNDGPSMHDLVAADIAARKEFGLQKYGTPLQAHNGRDALMDAYEETLDLIVYLRQAIEERTADQASWPSVATSTEPSELRFRHVRGSWPPRVVTWLDPAPEPRKVRPIEPSVERYGVHWISVYCLLLALVLVGVTLGYVIVNAWFS